MSDLRSIPGDILRNYALEGKIPIYLDKEEVEGLFFQPIEAPVFSSQKIQRERVIKHDPEKFAMAVKTLYFLRRQLDYNPPIQEISPPPVTPMPVFARKGLFCEHWQRLVEQVEQWDITHERLRHIFLETLWENREVLLEHLFYAKGIQVITLR